MPAGESDRICHAVGPAPAAAKEALKAGSKRRHLLAGAMEAAAAREHRIGGQADRRPIGEQRGDGRDAVRIVDRAERRHDDEVRGDREVGVAGGLDKIAPGNEPGRRNLGHLDAEGFGAALRIGVDRGVGIVAACGAR